MPRFALTMAKQLVDALRDLAPIVAVIVFFQVVVVRQPFPDVASVAVGLVCVVLGLALFIQGLESGLFPLGEALAQGLARRGSATVLLALAFCLGFGTTVAEPALIAVAAEAAKVAAEADFIGGSQAAQDRYALELRVVVALAVGLAIVLGVLRILKGWPIHRFIISGYVLVMVMTLFAPEEIVGVAYDSGGVTTSTITVPLITAWGVGLALHHTGAQPDAGRLWTDRLRKPHTHDLRAGLRDGDVMLEWLALFGETLLYTLRDVTPIVVILVVFQVGVLRRRLPNVRGIATGSVMVLLGLALFLIGLDQALFPIGETMARQLTEMAGESALAGVVRWEDYWVVYLFAAAIGFATTAAEPSLIAVAPKAQEVSGGAVNAWGLRIAVAVGVAAGVALGCFRIVTGSPLPWYILAAYVVVIVLTYLSRRTIIPLAYDSGGVTTSTVTVPVVAALGLGLAASVPGRSPLIRWLRAHRFRQCLPHHVGARLRHRRRTGGTLAHPEGTPGGEDMKMALVVALVSKDKTDHIVDAARAGGATGATIISSVPRRGAGTGKDLSRAGPDREPGRGAVPGGGTESPGHPRTHRGGRRNGPRARGRRRLSDFR